MSVPERDTVDRALASARSAVEKMSSGDVNATLADVIVCCTTALVHQIRDADDTQATVIAPAIRDGITDLTIVMGGKP